MKKNILLYVLAFLIPVCLFCQMYQSYRFNQLERDVSDQEKQQYALIEANKRSISAISVLAVPERIEEIATKKLSMRRAKPEEIVRIKINGEE